MIAAELMMVWMAGFGAPWPPAEIAADFTTVEIQSAGMRQKALWRAPVGGKPAPLLVALHTWSGDYRQRESIEYLWRAKQLGWALIHPDFQGPNVRPQACGSDRAVADIVDAVNFARRTAHIDARRIYLVGVSGGGYMALLMAARHPEIWAAVSSWAPITDLAAWHEQCLTRGLKYARDLQAVFGGPPGAGVAIAREYGRRSPLGQLGATQALPIDINAGIHDGHTGSVPISHALLAFNELAVASGHRECAVAEDAIRKWVDREEVPPELGKAALDPLDPSYAKAVLFRREAGRARITIFDGGHEILHDAAFTWLARHEKQMQ